MLVNKIHFWPKMQWMICTMLHFVRFVSLDIWHVWRYVCFWPLRFSKPTISSSDHVLQYMYASVCQSRAFVRCYMFPKSPLITFQLFRCCSLSSKILPVFSENCIFLNWYKFLIRALSPLLSGTLHHRYIFSALKLLFMTISFAFVYKHQKCV